MQKANAVASGRHEPAAAEACRYFETSVELFNKINAEAERARTLRAWAQCELARGESESGAKKLAAALEIFHRLGIRGGTGVTETALTQSRTSGAPAAARPIDSER
jgi:hypothetical protein